MDIAFICFCRCFNFTLFSCVAKPTTTESNNRQTTVSTITTATEDPSPSVAIVVGITIGTVIATIIAVSMVCVVLKRNRQNGTKSQLVNTSRPADCSVRFNSDKGIATCTREGDVREYSYIDEYARKDSTPDYQRIKTNESLYM